MGRAGAWHSWDFGKRKGKTQMTLYKVEVLVLLKKKKEKRKGSSTTQPYGATPFYFAFQSTSLLSLID